MMTIEQALELKHGDQVHWQDPDNGLCSGTLTIGDISVDCETGAIVITDITGDDIECWPEELS